MSSSQQKLDFAPRPPAPVRALKVQPGFELLEPRRCADCDAASFQPASTPCWICRTFPGLRKARP